MKKRRVDQLLVDRGLAETRNKAQRLIMAGQVRVNGEIVVKSSQAVEQMVELEVSNLPRFVSRGGEKLQAALDAFSLEIEGFICADIGASTGGFTDCLLQNGASRVYAIDVGKGLLHWRLRQDARVVLLEGVNARQPIELEENIELVTIDVSFISLKLILPSAMALMSPSGTLISLIKPQFEAGKDHVGKGGLVSDPAVHRSVIETVAENMQTNGLHPRGLIASPLRGPRKNAEFLIWCSAVGPAVDVLELIDQILT
jgi:23S rRNA (cytidine1920-2'-O)/16S rRNA (cytidine1409-2'-O)-methyltransferase